MMSSSQSKVYDMHSLLLYLQCSLWIECGTLIRKLHGKLGPERNPFPLIGLVGNVLSKGNLLLSVVHAGTCCSCASLIRQISGLWADYAGANKTSMWDLTHHLKPVFPLAM